MSEWSKWFAGGALAILFGVLALANAMAVSIAIVWVTGSMLLLLGLFQTVIGFSDDGALNRFLSVMLGLLTAVLGISFMQNPFEGMLTLTFVVTLLIGLGGVLRLIAARRMRQTNYFWMMLISGALSILLAGYIYANFVEASEKLLGILLGIELLFNGGALIVLALFLRAHSDEM